MRICALFLLLVTAVMAQGKADDLTRRFWDDYYFHFNPTQGTSAGFHEYDAKLEEFSKAAVDAQVQAARKFAKEFDASPDFPDRDLYISRLQSDLLALEVVRSWQTNPDSYSSGISGSVFTIMSRNFAPQEQRLRSVIARELKMPQVLRDARVNLKNPPKIFTEVALEQIPGIVSFFQTDVPSAFDKVTDKKLLADFHASNKAVIEALQSYEKFLTTDILPNSKGDFRLGADTYRKKLLYDEMVDIPLDRLLKIGYENLHANQKAFIATAKKIDPNKTPQQILDDAEKDHPPADQLLQSFRDVLSGLTAFIREHHIITIPSTVPPIVEETPPFARALSSASMDTPGPYEKVAKEAFFNVTLPEKTWTPKRVEEYMGVFNRGVITSTAIHEAYPGHYVQFLWVPSAPSKARKLLGCGSNAEGWAHYTEQMMLDEGYAAGNMKMRLGQLQDALLRNARYIVGIEMHTGKMTYEQGVDFFVKEGFQTRDNGRREARRGTSDPTYLVYTLGKLEIMKLREDYKQKKGSQFSLQEFHDSFMKQGFPPIKIVRRALLGDNSPAL